MATSIKLMKYSLRPALCLTARTPAAFLLPRIFSNQFHTHNYGSGGDRNNRNSPSFPDWSQRSQEKNHTRPDYYRDLGKEGEVKQPSMTIYGGKMGADSGDSKRGPGVDYGSQRAKDNTEPRKSQQSTTDSRSSQQSGSNSGASNISSGGSKSTDIGGSSSTNLGGSTPKTSTDSHNASRGHKSSHKSNLGNQTSSSGQEHDVSNFSMKGPAESNKTSQKDQTATSSHQGGIGAASDVMNRQSTQDHKHRQQHTRKTGHHRAGEHTPTENDQTSRPPSDMSDAVHRDPTRESGLKTAFAADASSKKAAEDKSAVVGDVKVDPTDTSFVQANPGNRAGTPLSSSNDDDYARSLKSGVKDNSYKVGMGNSGEANVKRTTPDGVSRPDDTVTREMAQGNENSGLEPGRSTGVGSNENITTKDIYTNKK